MRAEEDLEGLSQERTVRAGEEKEKKTVSLLSDEEAAGGPRRAAVYSKSSAQSNGGGSGIDSALDMLLNSEVEAQLLCSYELFLVLFLTVLFSCLLTCYQCSSIVVG